MANWDKVSGEGNVEDRRTARPGMVIGGVGSLILVLAFMFLGGKDPLLDSVLNGLAQNSGTQTTETRTLTPSEAAYKTFASKVLASNNGIWPGIFQQQTNGGQYSAPKLVLFRQATNAACGYESSAVGPNYCAADQTVYLDETFFDEIYKQFGGSTGDVAQAYVISHEVGHHIQNLLGTLESGASSVSLELQADCYAGIWAKYAADAGIITQAEMQEAISAASSVGDDHIQKEQTGTVRPDSFTHGSSAQRVGALKTGFSKGTLQACSVL